jgi:hypothetical protein
MVSRDDVESAIWMLAGRVHPWRVERIMRMIDHYVIVSARKWSADPIPDVVLPPAPKRAVKPKPVTTVTVMPVAAGPPRARDGFLYLCRLCKARKTIGAFPEAKRYTPGFSFACIECAGDERPKSIPQQAGYLCRLCGDRWPLAGFPPAKRDNPVISIACLQCEDARKAGDGRKLVNMTLEPIAS